MSQNGQTDFKNLAANAALCVKGLIQVIRSAHILIHETKFLLFEFGVWHPSLNVSFKPKCDKCLYKWQEIKAGVWHPCLLFSGFYGNLESKNYPWKKKSFKNVICMDLLLNKWFIIN